ncbi:MAG: hypothetical protein AAFR64_07145 [Pseudomonadota bacterium]
MKNLLRAGLLLLAVTAFSSSLGSRASATPPPPAPNACATHFCAEIFPVLSANGFITPEFEISSDDGSSAILARFDGRGSILLRNEIVDRTYCDRELGLSWTSRGSLEGYIELPPSPEREGKSECRSFTVRSLTNPDLAAQLKIVWFTADYTVGTGVGQIARNVELRIILPERP